MLRQWTMAVAIAAVVGSAARTGAAAEPTRPVIVHDGRLFDTTGAPLVDVAAVTFTLYDAAAGGRAVWSELLDVAFDDGHFSVTLGEVTPLGDSLSGGARWLAITVAGRPELPTRVAIAGPSAPPTAPPPRPAGVVVAASHGDAELAPLMQTDDLVFIGATVPMTVGPAQLVLVSASAVLGSTAPTGADSLQLSLCARSKPGTRLVDNPGDRLVDLAVAAHARTTFALKTRFAALTPGDHEFGLCARVRGVASRWNDNGASRVAVLVTTR